MHHSFGCGADRKTVGRAEGRITVNGFDKKPATFARVMGYCEQFDIHSPGLTVGESIHLSADLRLSSDITTEQVRPAAACANRAGAERGCPWSPWWRSTAALHQGHAGVAWPAAPNAPCVIHAHRHACIALGLNFP